MEVVESSRDEVVVKLNHEDIIMFRSAIGETLEALEDWELPIRTPFSREEFLVVQEQLKQLKSLLRGGH
ncbi:hypothetical protein ACQEU3_39175 [Spirillospora sp. CA-253888]